VLATLCVLWLLLKSIGNMKFFRTSRFASLFSGTPPTAEQWKNMLVQLDMEFDKISANETQVLELAKVGTHSLMAGAVPVMAVGNDTFSVKVST